jgi:adenine phosphoribosyltransferase
MSTEDKEINRLRDSIRDIPNFPKEGILFKDITTLLQDRELFKLSIDKLKEAVENIEFDFIAGVESRGFILGSALAYATGKAFIPIRKKGKLPYKKVSVTYDLEYGTDTIEMHEDSFEKGQKVLIIDDLLATGGTAQAACKLVSDSGADITGVLFLVELEFLKGRDRLSAYKVMSLISY